jgi:signal transduction histidine kinase
VFEKFHQAHGRSKRAGAGVGLGLAICREIARAHGGDVWVSDNRPSGSVFELLLPLSQPAGSRERATAEETIA